MKIKLAHLEARLQALIEGSAARLFPNHYQQTDLASRLVDAMRANLSASGREHAAPNLFTLVVHPSQAGALLQNRALIEELTREIREAGLEAGLYFSSSPVVRVAADNDVPMGEIRVLARNSRENLPQTTDLAVEDWEGANTIPPNAFLIVDGMRIFSLTQPVINIGRRSDNQLVIDDPRISRVHAQLRAVKGHFVIFDLDSTGGTFVNGKRVRQYTLYPGDVISLSNLPLVFGQDSAGLGETQDYNPFPADGPDPKSSPDRH